MLKIFLKKNQILVHLIRTCGIQMGMLLSEFLSKLLLETMVSGRRSPLIFQCITSRLVQASSICHTQPAKAHFLTLLYSKCLP